jgi:hypothetical protein
MTGGAGSSMFNTTRAMQVMILRISETGCSALHQRTAAFLSPAYSVIVPVVVREDKRNIHVPDHAKNVERPAINTSLAMVFTVEDHHS